MLFTTRIDETIKLASHLHRHQTRRDLNNTPYVSHLFSVAIILSEAGCDEETIIAGLMHDSLEDVPNYNYENLVNDCGENIANIVKHVTEPLDANKIKEEQLPWLERKEAYLKNLKEGEEKSAMVSAADKIHNLKSFIDGIERDGEVFLKHFNSSLVNTLWFNEEVLKIVREKLTDNHSLAVKLSESVEKLRKLVTVN